MTGVFDLTASVEFADKLSRMIPSPDPWEYDNKINPTEIRFPVDRGFVESTGRFDIEWYDNDDYSAHYKEPADPGRNTTFAYRFDKHPKSGVDNRHFHRPPDALSNDCEDSCIKVRKTVLVARAVAKSWTEAINVDDPDRLNALSNPP